MAISLEYYWHFLSLEIEYSINRDYSIGGIEDLDRLAFDGNSDSRRLIVGSDLLFSGSDLPF